MDIKTEIKKLIQFFKKDQAVYAGYWLGFILFICYFIFLDYQTEILMIFLFAAGIVLGNIYSNRRIKRYLDKYSLPDLNISPEETMINFSAKEYRIVRSLFNISVKSICAAALLIYSLFEANPWLVFLSALIFGVAVCDFSVYKKVNKFKQYNLTKKKSFT